MKLTYEAELETRAIIHASGDYLTKHLPDNYNDMENEDLHEYCEDNAWDPFEYTDGAYLFEMICDSGLARKRFVLEEIERVAE